MTPKEFSDILMKDFGDLDVPDFRYLCMIEYARLMCDKQKDICLRRTGLVPIKGFGGIYLDVDRECIINSPYPEELLQKDLES